MITVVAKADQPELFNIVRTTFHAWAQDLTTVYTDTSDQKNPSASSVLIRDIRGSNEIELDSPPAVWTQIEKFDLDGAIRAEAIEGRCVGYPPVGVSNGHPPVAFAELLF
jgi:SET domain-containing protein